jgi:two-component system, LytTR family, sensor kinase
MTTIKMKPSDTPVYADEILRLHDGIMNPGLVASIRRVAIVSMLGIVSLLFLGEILDVRDLYHRPISIILAVIGINLLSEGNVLINRTLNKKMPWFGKLTQRIAIQLGLSFVWLLSITFLFFLLAPRTLSKEAIMSFLFGTLFILFFNSILIMRNFAYSWRQSIVENEQLKQAKLHADYMALQNQLNPHFLFNSFSVLISEIQYNPESAVEFAQKMSDVYRYVLQQRNTTTTTLNSELNFMSDYHFLHKIRMGDALDLRMDIDPAQLNLELPPITLQVLVENAIKHNRATKKQPLNIQISSNANNEIIVTNNLNPKSTTHSMGVGLENIVERYKLLTNKQVLVHNDEKYFSVALPLLRKNELPESI